jgi:hypothetical protein
MQSMVEGVRRTRCANGRPPSVTGLRPAPPPRPEEDLEHINNFPTRPSPASVPRPLHL